MAQRSDQPFRMIILGDFSGRETTPNSPVEVPRLRAMQIDRDNFDAQLSKLNASLRGLKIVPDAEAVDVRFNSLECFHPDHLFQNLPIFASLRDLRQRLGDSSSFQVAADEVLRWGHVQLPQPVANDSDSTTVPSIVIDPENLLDHILEPLAEDAVIQAPKSEWQRMIDGIVAPYLVEQADPRQAEFIEIVDQATQAIMTDILQHPKFRRLEATWRALFFLIRRLETSPSLSVHIVDISKQELAQDLSTSTNIRESGLHRLLVEQTVETPGSEAWSVVAGNFEFGPTDEDAQLLAQIAEIAQAAGATLVAGADSHLVGCTGTSDSPTFNFDVLANQTSWQTLQKSSVASHIGLAWPRFLLRLPYGAETDPTEEFNYEERATSEHLLWGNSAFVACLLLGQAFAESDWSMTPGEFKEVSRLPVWTYDDEGESQLHPCGQYLLTERMIEALQSHGLMPIISLRNGDTIRLGGFYSLQRKRLAGPWD